MIINMQAEVDQVSPEVLTEGNMKYPRLSNMGQLFTAGWREKLIMAGRAYRMSIGTISGGDSFTAVGVATAVDLDLPCGAVAVDAGYLIPLSLQGSMTSDTDAIGDYVSCFLTADRATAIPGSEFAVATAETPDNLLDGAPLFQGRAGSVFATTPCTDPVHSDLLYHDMWSSVGANNLGPVSFVAEKTFEYPNFIKGPCTLLLYYGGTVQAHGMFSLCFAHVPASWFPSS